MWLRIDLWPSCGEAASIPRTMNGLSLLPHCRVLQLRFIECSLSPPPLKGQAIASHVPLKAQVTSPALQGFRISEKCQETKPSELAFHALGSSKPDIRKPRIWLWNHVLRGMLGILAMANETRLFLARTVGPSDRRSLVEPQTEIQETGGRSHESHVRVPGSGVVGHPCHKGVYESTHMSTRCRTRPAWWAV